MQEAANFSNRCLHFLLHCERPRSIFCTAWRAWRTLSARSFGSTRRRVRLVTTSDSIDRQAAAEEEKRGRQGNSVRHDMPSLRCGRQLTEARPALGERKESRSGLGPLSRARFDARCPSGWRTLDRIRNSTLAYNTVNRAVTAPLSAFGNRNGRIDGHAIFFGDFRL
jgi:hypothetical protein